MGFLWHTSIRQKLTWIIMLTSAAALLLACVAFITYESINSKREMTRDLSTTAEIIAANTTAALTFHDAKAAEEILATLRDKPHIVCAGIYSTNGTLFAAYVRADITNAVDWPVCEPGGHRFEANQILLFKQAKLQGEHIGTVYVRSDMQQVHARLAQYAKIVVAVLLVSLLAALVLSTFLQRVISKPILSLTETAKKVSENKDYSFRAVKSSRDEVGVLIDAFNDMLAQIQQRDKALGESEKHFRSLIENANDIITILDAKGVMHYNSPSIQRILGYSPEELTNKPVFEFVHPDDASTVIATFLRVAQSPDQVAPLEFRVRHKNGSWVPLESIGKNLLDDPVVAGVVVNSRDISERKEAEERLKTYAAKLESSNRELQDFAYVASHDLQEPLRKIQAFGDRLKIKCSALLDEQNRDYLDRMQHAARRMQTLITDLLAFSRVTTKAQPFARVDLDKVTREVVTDLEVAIERTKGRVEVDELPTIEADPLQMRQLIQNLVGNALKFHQPNQPPLVKISSQILNGEHRHNNGAAHRGLCCQLTVEDNGIGFDEKYLDRIFIIFQRLHGRNEFEGTGVGLAICRKIVDRHGGEITATSKPGQGARFVVTLPVNQQQKEKP